MGQKKASAQWKHEQRNEKAGGRLWAEKKKTGIPIGGGLLVGLWMMVSVVSAFTGNRKDSAVMWVGEIPVYEDEFKDCMQDEYANTCSYFSRMYGRRSIKISGVWNLTE